MEEMRRLYDQWLAMWNGDASLARELVSEDFVIHQARAGGVPSELQRGPRAITEMVEMGREPFDNIIFALEVGPICQGQLIAARWHCLADYRSGIPGTKVPAGSPVSFGGIDMLRVEGGQVCEYWVSSDGLALMSQLGVLSA